MEITYINKGFGAEVYRGEALIGRIDINIMSRFAFTPEGEENSIGKQYSSLEQAKNMFERNDKKKQQDSIATNQLAGLSWMNKGE